MCVSNFSREKKTLLIKWGPKVPGGGGFGMKVTVLFFFNTNYDELQNCPDYLSKLINLLITFDHLMVRKNVPLAKSSY